MHLRYIKILLLGAVALLGLISFFNNVSTLRLNFATVQMILSMENTFGWADTMWRSITNPYLVGMAYGLIIISEFSVGILCSMGVVKMWRSRCLSAAEFNNAKILGLTGCGIGVLLWFGGFIIIAGEWFLMWQHRAATLEHAFRFAGSIALIMLIVSMKDE